MNFERIVEKIDELNDKYIKVWADVCNLESPTIDKIAVDAVGSYFANLAGECGFRVEKFPQQTAGDVVCITMNENSSLAPVCLSGHMDTVHSKGSFGKVPVRIEDDKIYGPGVTDCKGGIVAGILAMDALRLSGFETRPVKLLLQSDEEKNLSNKTTIREICEQSKDAVAFLNLEGHTEGKACLERKGIVTYLFTIEGIEAHSSLCYMSGANAILEAAHKIIELEKIKDGEGITCCCSIISGGTTVNTVPGRCEFKVNVRYSTKEQLEWIEKHVHKVAETVHIQGCTSKVERCGFRIAMEKSERNVLLLGRMNSVFEKCGLPILAGSKRTGGSDAADVTSFGIPCIDSLGVRGGNIHTADEFAYLVSLKEAAHRIAAVVLGI